MASNRPPSGAARNLAGTPRIGSRFQADAPARVRGGVVTFGPGARAAWRTHPMGQTLLVTSGCGWLPQEGGPVQEIRPGDVSWAPPSAKHGHGATPTGTMAHQPVDEFALA